MKFWSYIRRDIKILEGGRETDMKVFNKIRMVICIDIKEFFKNRKVICIDIKEFFKNRKVISIDMKKKILNMKKVEFLPEKIFI